MAIAMMAVTVFALGSVWMSHSPAPATAGAGMLAAGLWVTVRLMPTYSATRRAHRPGSGSHRRGHAVTDLGQPFTKRYPHKESALPQ
ncbi:hypothetical protein [Nocardia jejuensis]|uniref:hypothetical protein n=1 Tax=Nocardia jejuensis TaxID=328049 RepID=UPI0008321219|nr:hypothetical protein [Nocardia jejuensis]